MNEFFRIDGEVLFRSFDSETLRIEPWGPDSIRVRAVRMGDVMTDNNWALSRKNASESQIKTENNTASLINGKIRAEVTAAGKLVFYNKKGDILLEEYARNRRDLFSKDCSALEIEGREFRSIPGGDYTLTARFESNPTEKLYGMGQYQQPYLDIKGCRLELAHRNSQASVPFVLSDSGYGFLWNNPAIGDVVFGKNVTEWKALSTTQLDYWITAGDTPAEIVESYADATGTVPMMPEYGLGFWQCKLRYQTQDELMEVAREYKRRKLPIDVIVVDFFHWPKQGDWKFDRDYWPDPDSMIAELKEMGIELMVSIWPTVDRESENYEIMRQRGLLVRTERGVRTTMEFQAPTVFFDPTNPESRDFVWGEAKKNYYDRGVSIFWLDEAEPEYTVYDFDNYRYHAGTNLRIGNLYPLYYAKTFFDGMQKEGQQNVVNLLRCAWAGSQKYGALVWSGDIASSFESMRNQLSAGLNMGIAGLPWWTTDIGGFHGGNPDDENFRELFARWFQWGTFCPVMRLHGDREPHQPQFGTTGGCKCLSGAANEVWSYGEKILEICTRYMELREKMRPYLRILMQQAHEKGTPVMRPLFYEFPEDKTSWLIEDEYMFGDSLLVAPVLEHGGVKRKIYLPAGASWKEYETGSVFDGGQFIEAEAPLESIPVFLRDGRNIFNL
ncbi:MAG: family 31 glucosidase [Spirochaetes bacterium]|nr:family 31 glucosidase [Spirochaetota bacterium]